MRHPDLLERPAMVTYAVGSQKLILDYSPELQGIQRDMPLQQALGVHGDVELLHADVPHYWSVFNGLLDALEKKSPLVEGSALGDIYIGLEGLHLLYPDDASLASAIREAVPAVFDAHIGIARGKFPAYLAALHYPPGGYKAFDGDLVPFLKDLSCDLLPVSLKSKERLHGFGLHTLGQVTALLPGPLQAQFGSEGKRIWELANGSDDTPLYPRMTEEMLEESATLPSVTISLDVMLISLEAMLSHAFTILGPKGMGIRRVTLWTRSWLAEHWECNIQFKEPVMTTKTALSRIKQVMENTPQPGPVEQLGMKITGLGRQHGRQRSLFSEVRAKDHLMDDIKQLEFRLGGPQLYKIMEVEPWSRIPERRYALKPLSQ